MKSIIICILIFLLFTTHALAWENKVTHPALSNYAAEKYFGLTSGFLDEDVNGNEAREWIKYGAEHEDDGFDLKYWTPALTVPRYLNHFHAPTKSLDMAGLDDTILNTILGGISTVIWAQDSADQKTATGGDWSWNSVRDYWYKNLTAMTDKDTDDNLEKLLKGIGYQMHLLQDMSQPDHVRNNTHMADGYGWNGLETWAAANSTIINNFAKGTIPDVTVDLTQQYTDSTSRPQVTLMPVANLFDSRKYFVSHTPKVDTNQGLSEYTNANFFSHSTIFANERFSTGDDYYFPFPRRQSTDIQSYIDKTKPSNINTFSNIVANQAKYISKTGDGESLTYLAAEGARSRLWLNLFGEEKMFYRSFKLDEACYYSYAQKLIPMAVGYSKALLDYFFRGEIELTLPSAGVYSAAPVGNMFTELRVNAKNITATGEEMSDGTVQLAVTYSIALADPFQSVPVDVEPQYHHIVVPEKNGIRYIPKSTTRELVFDLSSTPIPIWATDVEIRVIYKGILGGETYAVASGVNDISEPTPVDVFNNTDYTCLNNNWYRYDDPVAMALADKTDIYQHSISNITFQGGPANAVTITSSPQHNNLSAAGPLQPGQMLRLGYILTDYANRYAFDEQWTNLSVQDDWTTTSSTTTFTGTGFVDQAGMGLTSMYNMRGKKMGWGASIIYVNDPYPANSICDTDLLNQPAQ